MLTRTLGLLILSTLLALSMAATAQTFNVGFEGGGDSVDLAPGESTSISYTVYLEGDQFNCLQNHDMPVEMAASGSQGITIAVDPDELVFSNTQGIHASDTAAGGYNESGSASVTITAPATASSSFSADITVEGTFPGGDYGPPDRTCGPSGNFPSATGDTLIRVNVVAPATDDGDGDDGGAGGGGGGAGGNGTDGNDDGGDDDGNGIPLPAWTVPAGLIAAAMLTRRRAE